LSFWTYPLNTKGGCVRRRVLAPQRPAVFRECVDRHRLRTQYSCEFLRYWFAVKLHLPNTSSTRQRLTSLPPAGPGRKQSCHVVNNLKPVQLSGSGIATRSNRGSPLLVLPTWKTSNSRSFALTLSFS